MRPWNWNINEWQELDQAERSLAQVRFDLAQAEEALRHDEHNADLIARVNRLRHELHNSAEPREARAWHAYNAVNVPTPPPPIQPTRRNGTEHGGNGDMDGNTYREPAWGYAPRNIAIGCGAFSFVIILGIVLLFAAWKAIEVGPPMIEAGIEAGLDEELGDVKVDDNGITIINNYGTNPGPAATPAPDRVIVLTEGDKAILRKINNFDEDLTSRINEILAVGVAMQSELDDLHDQADQNQEKILEQLDRIEGELDDALNAPRPTPKVVIETPTPTHKTCDEDSRDPQSQRWFCPYP